LIELLNNYYASETVDKIASGMYMQVHPPKWMLPVYSTDGNTFPREFTSWPTSWKCDVKY